MGTQLVLNKYNINYEALRLADLTALAFNLGKILLKLFTTVTPGLQKDINRAIIYVPGSSHTYIQQNEQYIIAHIT